MNAYKLDDKEMDKCFLKGDPVICKAVITLSDHASGALKAGEKIVVLLSTGKKYMGEIQNFNFINSNKYLEGRLEIVRYPKT